MKDDAHPSEKVLRGCADQKHFVFFRPMMQTYTESDLLFVPTCSVERRGG